MHKVFNICNRLKANPLNVKHYRPISDHKTDLETSLSSIQFSISEQHFVRNKLKVSELKNMEILLFVFFLGDMLYIWVWFKNGSRIILNKWFCYLCEDREDVRKDKTVECISNDRHWFFFCMHRNVTLRNYSRIMCCEHSNGTHSKDHFRIV